MVKKKVKYKRVRVNKFKKDVLMPEITPNINPDDIEIGDEITPKERNNGKKDN